MAEAMPEVPEFITPEMEARWGAEAQRAVRSRREPQPDEVPRESPGRSRRWLDAESVDTVHTVLAGATIAVVIATAAIGLLFVWLAVPSLAYMLVGVAGACAVGWAIYFPLARRTSRDTGR